jgi:hypothetical protein
MKKVTLLLTLLGLVVFQACDNHVHDHDDDHAEPVGFFLRESGVNIVTYQNATVQGSITVQAGDETGLVSVVFIDEDGDEFTPEGDVYSLSLETTSTNFEFEQHAEDGKWRFHVVGLQAGTGTFTLKLMHGDHSDFRSQPITVTVTAPAAVAKQ